MPGLLPAWRLATRRSASSRTGFQVAALADLGFFLAAGLVELSVLAAALLAAGLFAVFMVLAVAVLVSGAAAFGAAAFFAAGFAAVAFAAAAGLAALAGAALVLAEAGTAMACARGRFVVLSSFIRDAFLDGVA